MKSEIKMDKEDIQQLGLKAIQDYFKINPSNFEPEFLRHLHQKAKLGMSFEREVNLSKRAIEHNYLRVFKLIAEDKAELRKLIKKSIPQYIPT